MLSERGHNMAFVRERNRSLVLRTLARRGALSRGDLRSITRLAPSAISSLVKELIQKGFVTEVGAAAHPRPAMGRTPQLIALSSSGPVVLAVDVARHHVDLAAVTLHGEIVHQTRVVNRIGAGVAPDAVLSAVADGVVRALNAFASRPVVGLGVAVPGWVSTSLGAARFVPGLDWRDVPIAAYLKQATGLQVVVDNNVRAMARAELWFGSGRETGDLVLVQVGPGMGAAIAVGGALLTGSLEGAGELGHCVVEPGGPTCQCGRRGCLEAVVSTPALLRAWAGMRDGPPKSDVNPPNGTSVTTISNPPGLDHLLSAYRAGDRKAAEVLTRAARTLGLGVSLLINLVNPELVVWNGALLRDESFRLWVEQQTTHLTFAGFGGSVRFELARFGDQQGLVGAAALAWERFAFAPDIALGEQQS